MNPALTPKAIVAALDEHIIGQAGRQARGRRRAAQPLARQRSARSCATR
ncbi:MAG: hypothetical protein LKM31_13430 [Sphingobium sp.]|nr:hypothetical protein [Sphingobium sp.]